VIATDYHGVVERSAARQARRPQSVQFIEKAESARPTQLRLEGFCIEQP
jgi:hypothetical protein